MNNQLAAVKLLLNASANLNLRDNNGGKTPLMLGNYILFLANYMH